MTDKQRLEAYVRDCADLFGLPHWEITLDDESADDGNIAQIQLLRVAFRAYLRVAADFAERGVDEIRETIVHELVHLHFANALYVVEDDFKKNPAIAKATAEAITEAYVRQHEIAVDSIARAIACDFPLIQLPKQKRHR